MSKKQHRSIPVLAALLVVTVGLALPAMAQKKFLEKIRRAYQLDATTGKCTLCHKLKEKEDPGKENLNPFGKDLQADPAIKPALGHDDDFKFTDAQLEAVLKAAQNIDDKDSDGDGVTNKEELDLGSFPGDKDSKPDAKKLEAYRKAHPKK
ncbi:MAG: hypothetical protein HY291_11460 [Planctomycetes bacterium]|nr:hypothetical protein [Planctomycetota bacterium]